MYTDHKVLKSVPKMRDPHRNIARWIRQFAEIDFEILYRPGDNNTNENYTTRPADGIMTIETQRDTFDPELASVI